MNNNKKTATVLITKNAVVLGVLLSTGVACTPSPPSGGGTAITTGTLANELADRDSLASFPAVMYRQKQASSHDTRNRTGYSRLGAPWGSVNVDFGNYLREVTINGRQELVMMEDDGPGVITRWWTTGIDQPLLDNNRLRVYIDGATVPVIDASAETLIGGNNSGFGNALNFATPEIGGNLYAPIAYRESIMITWDGPMTHDEAHIALRDPNLPHSVDSALWYNINYRELPSGANVTSYTEADKTTYQANLTNANARLSALVPTGSITQQFADGSQLSPGQSFVHQLQGPGAIRRLQLNVSGSNQAAALTDTTIVLTFDGQQTARIPVGQFFGNGLSESAGNPYNTGADYMRRVASDGTMLSLWVMPYQSAAEVRIVNEGNQAVTVDMEVDSGAWSWHNNSMHFHADYVSEQSILTRQAPGGAWPGDAALRELYSAEGDGDFRFIDIRGRGVLVGDTMSIRNTSTGAGLNGWWGEGDEKIYIDYLNQNGDGSAGTPTHMGTGTEDYYGYSFGSGQEFLSPFVTQPNAAGNRGTNGELTIQGRVRGLDAIAFEQSLKMDMEIWKWQQGQLDLAAATFWYGAPGAVSLHPVADLAVDFGQAGSNSVPDTAGDGQWQYLSSNNANPSAPGADTQPLAWGVLGNQGNSGYGGGQNGTANLPAIAKALLFETGVENIIIHGQPGYHELHVHPGGLGFEGDAVRDYVVARWVAGPSSAGLVNIAGTARNLADGNDSVDFYVYVNGTLMKSTQGNGTGNGTLSEYYYEFDMQLAAGDTVDFVVGNGGQGNLFDDESVLRAIIRAPR